MPFNKRRPIHALGSVSSAGAVVSGCLNVTPARTAAGKYTLTLGEALDAAQGVCSLTPRTATDDVDIGFVWTDDTTITIETWAVGVAADAAFDFVIFNAQV